MITQLLPLVAPLLVVSTTLPSIPSTGFGSRPNIADSSLTLFTSQKQTSINSPTVKLASNFSGRFLRQFPRPKPTSNPNPTPNPCCKK